MLREVPAWLLRAPQGPWSLRKWMAGLGVVPCFSGSPEKPPRRRWARLPREGGLRPCARPLGLLWPLRLALPQTLWGLVLDFLPPLPECREQAGSLCPPTFEGRVL